MGLLSLQDGSSPGRYFIPQASPAVGLFFQIVCQPVMSAVPMGTRSGFVVSVAENWTFVARAARRQANSCRGDKGYRRAIARTVAPAS